MLMACSVSDKKSPRRGRRAEPQSTDSRRQTRRKHASRTLERLHLSSCYFLKRSKTDISQNVKLLEQCFAQDGPRLLATWVVETLVLPRSYFDAVGASTGVAISSDALSYVFGDQIKFLRLTPEPKRVAIGIITRKEKLSLAAEKFCQCAREAFGSLR
jgi:hypothetical protein